MIYFTLYSRLSFRYYSNIPGPRKAKERYVEKTLERFKLGNVNADATEETNFLYEEA